MSRYLYFGFRNALLAAITAAQAGAAAPEAVEILRAKCTQCHSKTLSMSGLDLSSREAALRGGSRGAVLVAGKASESKLIEAVERKGKLAMPPTLRSARPRSTRSGVGLTMARLGRIRLRPRAPHKTRGGRFRRWLSPMSRSREMPGSGTKSTSSSCTD